MINEQHDAAFRQVQAYVILKGSERVATIAFKFPHDGAGRLYAYVHWLGASMVRGYANGYGYDKRSAAVKSAVRAIQPGVPVPGDVFCDALRACGGLSWDRALENAGFTVFQAV